MYHFKVYHPVGAEYSNKTYTYNSFSVLTFAINISTLYMLILAKSGPKM